MLGDWQTVVMAIDFWSAKPIRQLIAVCKRQRIPPCNGSQLSTYSTSSLYCSWCLDAVGITQRSLSILMLVNFFVLCCSHCEELCWQPVISVLCYQHLLWLVFLSWQAQLAKKRNSDTIQQPRKIMTMKNLSSNE